MYSGPSFLQPPECGCLAPSLLGKRDANAVLTVSFHSGCWHQETYTATIVQALHARSVLFTTGEEILLVLMGPPCRIERNWPYHDCHDSLTAPLGHFSCRQVVLTGSQCRAAPRTSCGKLFDISISHGYPNAAVALRIFAHGCAILTYCLALDDSGTVWC